MTLGDLIKNYRKENNYSMERFAKRCGLSKSYISMLEANKDPRGKQIVPRIETVIKVADAMNTTLDELIAELDYNFAVRINNEIVSEEWESDAAVEEDFERTKGDRGEALDEYAKTLYEQYQKASPEIQKAVDLLLKAGK